MRPCEPGFPSALCLGVTSSSWWHAVLPGCWPLAQAEPDKAARSKEKSCDVSGQGGHGSSGTGRAPGVQANKTPRGSGSPGGSLAEVFAQVIREPVARGGKKGSGHKAPPQRGRAGHHSARLCDPSKFNSRANSTCR